MKKIYLNIFINLFIILISYIIKDNLFLFVLSFSLYLTLNELLDHIDISKYLDKYNDKNNVKRNIFLSSLKYLLILGIFIITIITLSGYGIEQIFKIKGITIIYLFTSISSLLYISIKLLNNYLESFQINKNIINIYKLLLMPFILIIGIIIKVANINTYISILLIYLIFILTAILLHSYSFIFYQKKLRTIGITRIEYKVDITNITKKVFSENIKIDKVLLYLTLYLSIIYTYYVFTNRYGYNKIDTSNTIINGYFYSLNLIILFINIIKLKYQDKFNRINNLTIKKDYSILGKELSELFIKLLNNILPIIILVCFLAKPIWYLLYQSNNYGIFMLGIVIIIFYLYFYLMSITLENLNKKNNIIMMLVYFISKILLVLPMIDSIYRMGYNLLFGDIISYILAFIISIILSIIFIRKKIKIKITNQLNKILNTIYINIILCLILVLLNFIVPFNNLTIIKSILVIIFYIIVYISYKIILKKVGDKS